MKMHTETGKWKVCWSGKQHYFVNGMSLCGIKTNMFPLGSKVKLIDGGRTGTVVKSVKIEPPVYPLNDLRTPTHMVTIEDEHELFNFPNTWLEFLYTDLVPRPRCLRCAKIKGEMLE
jgi:hypothetical protein